MTDTTDIKASAKTKTRRPRKMAREPKAEGAELVAPTAPAKRESKASLVLGLLHRPEGATITQLVKATGWLPHTTRAALTGLRKKGHVISKAKQDDVTCYHLVTEAAA